MELKPIETQYKGYRFRSRLEARWAVFFDALNQRWEYEKEGYELDHGVRYLPDFWLPLIPGYNSGHFIEIKSTAPDGNEREKLSLLSVSSVMPAICFWGHPNSDGDWHMTLYRRGECRMNDGIFKISNSPQSLLFMDDELKRFYYLPFDYTWHIEPEFVKIEQLKKAFISFNSARFEFGEKG